MRTASKTFLPVRPHIVALFLLAACIGLTCQANAESLFRAGIAYQTSQPYTPKSMFAIPRPSSVGDIVTININETTQVNVQNSATIDRKQDITENNTSFFNNVIKRVTDYKKDFFPTVDGIQNQNSTVLSASSQKKYQYRDSVTCQVVQVLPNGNLVVQGYKKIAANLEEQNLAVTGIVNPYYLNADNTIDSKLVANLQMNVSGHGTISRQQGDGLINKYFQFFK